MKRLTLSLLTSISLTARAAEFSFRPHIPLLSKQAEHLKAPLKTSTTSHECMVDTGARFTLGQDTVFGKLEKVGEIKGGGLSNMELPTDLVQTDVSVGDWKIPNALLGRTNRIPFDCLIGNDFFIGRAFSIDFQTYKISELESMLSNSYPLDVYHSDHGGHFGFAVQIANYSTNSLFDTGASQTVVDQKIVDLNPNAFKFIKDLSATDGNNVKIKAGLYKLSLIKFGPIELQDLNVVAVDLSALTKKIPTVDVVFGLDIIQKYNWLIDTKSKTWSLKNF